MNGELIPFGNTINLAELDIEGTARRILLGGHALHAFTSYESGKYRRNAVILDKPDLSLHVPVLGSGKGSIAEIAIVRALYTYTRSQAPGGRHPEEYAEGRHGRIDPLLAGRSQLDYTLEENNEFWLYQEDDVVVAGSGKGGGPLGVLPFKVQAPDAVSALENLVDGYNFDLEEIEDIDEFEGLPKTLFR